MDVAKFLDQPIRFNPRRPRAPLVLISSSLLPSPSRESASPAPLLASTSSIEFDASLSSENCFLPAQNPTYIAPRTSSRQADRKDQILEIQEKTSAKSDRRSKEGQRKIIKSACSACRRRKSKCDGKRPTCSACILKERCCEYPAGVGVTSQAANRERLESYVTILGLIRDADSEDCDRILQDFRAPQTLNEAIETVQRNWILEFGNRAAFRMHTRSNRSIRALQDPSRA